MASAPVKTNDEIAAEKYGAVSDKFIADSQNATWVMSTANLEVITGALRELGLDFDLQGLKIASLYALSLNRLTLKSVAAPAPVIIREPAPEPTPTPAPKQRYKGTQQEQLEQVGYKPCLRESPSELADAAKERANKARSALTDLRDTQQRQKDAEQRFAEETQLVYIQSGPLRGKVDHGKTAAAQAEAKRRWAAKS